MSNGDGQEPSLDAQSVPLCPPCSRPTGCDIAPYSSQERPQLRRRLAGRFTDYGWLLEAWQTCAGDTVAEVRAATDGVRSRGRFPLVGPPVTCHVPRTAGISEDGYLQRTSPDLQ